MYILLNPSRLLLFWCQAFSKLKGTRCLINCPRERTVASSTSRSRENSNKSIAGNWYHSGKKLLAKSNLFLNINKNPLHFLYILPQLNSLMPDISTRICQKCMKKPPTELIQILYVEVYF